jgi:hypothetical protein
MTAALLLFPASSTLASRWRYVDGYLDEAIRRKIEDDRDRWCLTPAFIHNGDDSFDFYAFLPADSEPPEAA